MDAASKLRKFLTDRSLTQEKFEKKYRISQAAVSAWVKRRKRPSWVMARKLQDITDIKAERWLEVAIVPLPKKPPKKKDEAA